MKRLLVPSFTEELPLKILALLLAVTLFAIVRSDKDAATGVMVKVIYQLPEDRVLVSDPVSEVRVAVRGPWTRLSHFDEREVDPIRIDLSRYHDGQLRFDEEMVKLPVGLRPISISPSEVKLEFDQRIERELPVQPIVEGEPADGYRVVRLTAAPSVLRVDGAKRVVEGMRRVPTRPLRVAGARNSLRGEVALEPPPRFVRFVAPIPVVVEAEVLPAIVERTLEQVVVGVSGLTRLDSLATPPEVRIILRGPSDRVLGVALDAVAATVDAQLADLRPPSRYQRHVTVQGLPPGVAAEVQPDTVIVTTRRRRE